MSYKGGVNENGNKWGMEEPLSAGHFAQGEETVNCGFTSWQYLCRTLPAFYLLPLDWQGPHIFCGT